MFITRRQPLFLTRPDEGPGAAGQAPEVETPETAANTPNDGTGTDQHPQTNWEDRYKDAQAWGTRNAQRVAELEAHEQLINAWKSEDPEAQRWAAEQLGIQLEEETAADDLAGQYAQLDPAERKLLDEFKQSQIQQQQTQQEQQQYQAYRADVDPQLKDMGVPDALHELVAEAALNLPGVQDQYGQVKPDLNGAMQQVEDLVLAASDLPSVQNKVLDRYRKTKRAPHISSTGTAGTQVPDLDKRSDRVAWMTERLTGDQL